MRKIRETLNFSVSEELSGSRLDLFLSRSYPELSRSYIKRLIEEGYVLVNGKETLKPSRKVRVGEEVSLSVPEPESLEVRPENIPLDILYEDKDIAVLVKPCGLVVHPSPGYTTGTLVNALLYHLNSLSSVGGTERPGIVHRLDKDTAGLMVIAKSDIAHRRLVAQFQSREVNKLYMALVKGIPKQEHGIIDAPIGRHPTDRKKFKAGEGKEAITEFWVEEKYDAFGVSLLKVKIYTGRTHQIRVHLSSLGLPILGDITYGYKRSSLPEKLNRAMGECNMLVAYKLGFLHPTVGRWMEFEIAPPEPFGSVLRLLKEG